jgi:hypothetical protein
LAKKLVVGPTLNNIFFQITVDKPHAKRSKNQEENGGRYNGMRNKENFQTVTIF